MSRTRPPFDDLRTALAVFESKATSVLHEATPGAARSQGLIEALSLASVLSAGVSSKTVLVDLVARYSKQTDQIKRVHSVARLVPSAWPARPEPVVSALPLEQRLAESDIVQLVAGYQAGATGRALAEQFGLARSTVIKLLRERGVEVRQPRISAEDAALAVEWYRHGVRQVDIAERLGKHKSVVWHLLRRSGEL